MTLIDSWPGSLQRTVPLLLLIGVAFPSREGAAQAAPVPEGGEAIIAKGCVTAECHGEYGQGLSVHQPVKEGDCVTCHRPVEGEEHAFVEITRAQTSALCANCHEASVPDQEHFPYRTGLCTVCHDPHQSDQPTLFTMKNDGALCFQCHDRDHIFPARQQHGPAAVGGCTLCHNPHGSDEKQFLKASRTDLCRSCHESVAGHIDDSTVTHPPVMQACPNCHSPHGTDHGAHLLDAVPDLCYRCHEDIRLRTQESAVMHGAINEPRSCLNCHDPHGAQLPKLLAKQPMSLCLDCHDKPRGALIGIGDHLRAYPDHHGPIRQGACPECHNPHGSDNFRMLVRSYPDSFYTKSFSMDAFALCVGCHEQERFLEQYTTEFTNFRQGERNLHFVHVNRERKGRTCKACHDVHASEHPFHIRDSVPFGIWNLPINYERLPSGGRCSPGCHVSREYDPNGSASKEY